MLSLAVRIINIGIALIVVLIGFAVYWYAVRPLPKTAGEITAPIGSRALVERDARGVPHIEAASWQDAIFLQGFVTAQDRLWQMDALRRYAAGELAEVFGPSALREDQQARRMQFRAIAEADATQLTAEERTLFSAYARGVNYFIETHRGDYQLEFSLPGHTYAPRSWSVVDSILVGLLMYRDLTESAGLDLERAEILSTSLNRAKFNLLFPSTQGGYVNPGSNAWAVSGSRTADGKPILANDPHLAYGIPSTWHLVHLTAPGLNVTGCALPGLPGVILGHNDRIAWGVTNLQSDVQDIYVEQMDARSGRYLYRGQLEQARLDSQMVPVHGAKPVRLDTWVTRHGPVIAAAPGKGYSLRWIAADGFRYSFWAIDRAQDWSQFRQVLSAFWGPGQNFLYADREGNIGYQAAGRLPIRRGFNGDVPLDGASGKFEWDGYIPFAQMPTAYNPPSGILASANQDPFPAGYSYSVGGGYADPYRVRQIRALLSAKQKLDVEDMLAIQKDVYSAYDFFLAQQILSAISARGNPDAALREVKTILSHWNGQMDKSQAAPVIIELFSNQLGQSLAGSMMAPSVPSSHPIPSKARKSYRIVMQTAPRIFPRPYMIETLLRKRPAGWLSGEDWNSWLLANLIAALEQGRHLQGSPVSNWRWGRVLAWKVMHPVGKQLPFVDRFFDIGPVEMSGSGTTVKQTTTTLGPSERMVVDLGDLDKSVQNLPTGESGHVASAHYKDQWMAYYAGRSYPMEFRSVDAKEILRVKPGRASK